jgi:RES domain-containing protein
MVVYRICRRAFRALDGEGARLYGGRWNTPGVPIIYCSESLSLAALEYLMHVDADLVPADLVALSIDVPGAGPAHTVPASDLPRHWREETEHAGCQALGNVWARDGSALVLRVPAAAIPEEYNVLINPRHPHGAHVRLVAERAFAFDPRLLK